jgi:MerR family transcriptional regulator, light-induced transcriptional regulator
MVKSQAIREGFMAKFGLQTALAVEPESVVFRLERIGEGAAAQAARPHPFLLGRHSLPAFAITRDRVDAFARRAVAPDPRALTALAGTWRQRGLTRGALLGDLVPATARLLGEWWCDDTCGFSDVTIGMVRLQSIVRHAAGEEAPPSGAQRGGTCLITSTPSDQHTMGAVMLAEAFRDARWTVRIEIAPTEASLAARLRSQAVDLLCISAANESSQAVVARIIPALREASLNRAMAVMVGGPCFLRDPRRAVACGADGTAETAEGAVALARELLSELSGESIGVH